VFQSGTISFSTIELAHHVLMNLGYLERMGLVSYELKGNVWFLKIENAVLVPQFMKADVSMRNFSLSHNTTQTVIPKGNRSEGKPFLEVFPDRETIESVNKQKNNNLQGEREKTSSAKSEDDTQATVYLKALTERVKQ
jgi:hypothetical protein